MAMTAYTGEVETIAKIGTTPQERAMETAAFKAAFSKDLKAFVTWFNATHKTEFDAHTAETVTKLTVMGSDLLAYLAGQTQSGYFTFDTSVTDGVPERNYYSGVYFRHSYGNGYVILNRRTNPRTTYINTQANSGWGGWKALVDENMVAYGSGSPEGAITAPIGTLYRRTDVGELYVKKTGTGNTGWGKATVT